MCIRDRYGANLSVVRRWSLSNLSTTYVFLLDCCVLINIISSNFNLLAETETLLTSNDCTIHNLRVLERRILRKLLILLSDENDLSTPAVDTRRVANTDNSIRIFG